ncbi:MAG: PCRF domain-containing protein [Bacteroidota bacterium]|jgi:protein subunit release factor B
MEKILVEIRAGEGGRDAQLLVEMQMELYLKFCVKTHL